MIFKLVSRLANKSEVGPLSLGIVDGTQKTLGLKSQIHLKKLG